LSYIDFIKKLTIKKEYLKVIFDIIMDSFEIRGQVTII